MGFIEMDPEFVGEILTPDDKADTDEGSGPERIQMDVSPGSIEQLPPGHKFTSWDPQHPNAAFDPFVCALLRAIAAGADVSYASLTGDLSKTSYASGRMGMLGERDNWQSAQVHIAEHVLTPIYEEFCKYGLLTGAIRLPARDLARYQAAANWRPRGWPWTDPLKDAQADILSIMHGLSSRTRVLADQGIDVEDVYDELDHENQLEEFHNLSLAKDAKATLIKEPNDGSQATDQGNGDSAAPAQRIAGARSPRLAALR
jgi:lambda family phage portal protein